MEQENGGGHLFARFSTALGSTGGLKLLFELGNLGLGLLQVRLDALTPYPVGDGVSAEKWCASTVAAGTAATAAAWQRRPTALGAGGSGDCAGGSGSSASAGSGDGDDAGSGSGSGVGGAPVAASEQDEVEDQRAYADTETQCPLLGIWIRRGPAATEQGARRAV
jgi:hypothetical protein